MPQIPDDEIAPRPAEELRARVAAISRLAHQVRLLRLGDDLPGLLADLRTAAAHADDTLAPEIQAMLAETWVNARMIARILGYPDLAQSMTERYAQSAERSGDPYAITIGTSLRAAELIQVDRGHAAARLLDTARQATGEPSGSDPPQAWAAWGWSHLQSALSAARNAGNAAAADFHLSEAVRAADHLPANADHYRMTLNRPTSPSGRSALPLNSATGRRQSDAQAPFEVSLASHRTGYRIITLTSPATTSTWATATLRWPR
ncbi:hypothetical protein AB0M95_27205 [Sphaerisporangium sp. NPDC051017]|uniref:hypothetical protein n=1 Tax=Sphaerisporangium sp. NPDC051017 TaxID=3154636 RepID=UPI00342F951D